MGGTLLKAECSANDSAGRKSVAKIGGCQNGLGPFTVKTQSTRWPLRAYLIHLSVSAKRRGLSLGCEKPSTACRLGVNYLGAARQAERLLFLGQTVKP